MGDDGIAILIAEKLIQSLEEKGIEVIIGETDFQYCLNKIQEHDYILILDATWFGIKPGYVTLKPLKDIYKLNCNKGLFSQHGYSLIRALESYTSVDGFVIGIEGANFDFDFKLSSCINEQFENICRKVEEICKDFLLK